MGQNISQFVPVALSFAVVVLLGAISAKLFDKTSLVGKKWLRKIVAIAILLAAGAVTWFAAPLLDIEKGFALFLLLVGMVIGFGWLIFGRPKTP